MGRHLVHTDRLVHTPGDTKVRVMMSRSAVTRRDAIQEEAALPQAV